MRSSTIITSLLALTISLCLFDASLAQINVSPIGLSETLEAEQTSTQNVTISNNLGQDVPFTVKFAKVERDGRRDAPRRDAIGDVVAQYQIENGRWYTGIAWDGQEMWGFNHNGGEVISFDPVQGQVTERWNAGIQGITGMEYANDEIWIPNRGDGNIYRFDLEGNALERIHVPRDNPIDVAWDGENIWYTSLGNDRANLIQINMGGELLRVVRLPDGQWDGWASMEFVEEHPDGQMWMRDHGRSIYQLNIEGESAEIVQTMQLQLGNEFGLSHDGENIWYTVDGRDTWVVADDGVSEVRWLSVEPKEGVVPANETVELEFTFNSENMDAGFSEYWVDIEFDGREQYNVRMSAILTVSDETSGIGGAITDAATGEIIHGAKASLDVYAIDRLSAEDGNYAFSDLPAGVYNIAFTCSDYLPATRRVQLGDDDAVLNVGLLHAEFTPSEQEIAVQLAPDSETDVDFSITNGGNGPLTFSAERKLLGDANAEPWEVRRTLNIGQTLGDDRIEGVAFNGENFFFAGAAGDAANTIYVVNLAGERVSNFNQLGNSRYGMKDLEFDGNNFWGAGEQNVYCFDADGAQIISFQGPFNPTNNIAYDQENETLWLSGTTTNISAYDRAGNALNHVLNRKGLRIYGLSYWPDDPDGYNLYIVDSPAAGIVNIHKMNTANGDTMLAYSVPNAANIGASGVFISNAYDVYSWVLMAMSNVSPANGGDGLSIYQLDARKDWFALNPTEGVIEAGGHQDFVLNLDASGLPAVLFEAEIVFTHDGIGGETHLPISLDVVEGPVQAVRNIPLAMGWNLISANLQPDAAAFADLTRPLVDSGVIRMVKDDRGHFMTVGANAFNNLPDWEVSEGYLIKVAAASVLQVGGMTVMADDPIHLDQGWQMISYYPRRAVAAPVAFSAIDEQLQIVKDGFGNFYLPAYNYDNMGLMHEGMGYQIRVIAAVDLVYQIQGQGRDAAPYLSVQGRSGLYALHAQTGSNMSLLVEAPGLDGEIGVYASGELVGTGVLDRGRAGVAIWGDDLSTSVRDGAIAGENLEVRLMNELGEQVLSTALVAGEMTYSTDGFAVVRASESANPSNFGLAGVYPNPFNGRTTARVIVPESGKVQLALYDLGGRMIREVVAGRYEVGRHNIAIDAGDLASGVYLLRVDVAGRTSQMKIALVR